MIVKTAITGGHAVQELRADLHQSPEDATLQQLRGYLADPASLSNPQDHWADSGLIRRIQPTPSGNPKSTAWFMKFQRENRLEGLLYPVEPAYGRRREWTFANIALAWNAYYRKR